MGFAVSWEAFPAHVVVTLENLLETNESTNTSPIYNFRPEPVSLARMDGHQGLVVLVK